MIIAYTIPPIIIFSISGTLLWSFVRHKEKFFIEWFTFGRICISLAIILFIVYQPLWALITFKFDNIRSINYLPLVPIIIALFVSGLILTYIGNFRQKKDQIT